MALAGENYIVQASSVSANPLLALNSLLRASGGSASDVFAPTSTDKTDSAKFSPALSILPPSSATPLSFENVLALQTIDDSQPQALSVHQPTPEELFLKEAQKSPMERMRDQILQSMGLTEESLAQMPPEARRAAEDKIAKMIQEKIKLATGVDKNSSNSTEDMLQAVA